MEWRPLDVSMSETELTHRPVQNVVVILNPASGRGRSVRRRAELETLLERAAGGLPVKPLWRIVETARPGDATAQAALAASEGADVVAAAGGDGTWGETVNGLVGTGVRLALLPFGTGNDFSRTLGIGTDLPRAAHALFHGIPRSVDLGHAQGRWFLNVAGCGFDAVVAERFNRGYRWLHGTAAYVAAVCHSLITYRPARMRLTVDGETTEMRAMLCAVANAQSYGGGMRVAPDAKIDDGLFDICVIGDVGRIEFLTAFPRVFRGAHVTHPKVTMLRGAHVRVETDPPLPVLMDGDVVGNTPIEFTIAPGAIEVMSPAYGQGKQG